MVQPMTADPSSLQDSLDYRFADAPAAPEALTGNETVAGMAARGSCRRFADRAVDTALLRTLAAVALASPTKSDLQQRDIVLVADRALRDKLAGLVADQDWIAGAPAMLVFCGNNRRQRLIHQWRERPFANDHLDAFFNAAVDAGIALGAFVTAAEAAGLGCCPISALRNEPEAVRDLLALPDHVFPVAGLAVGWPARKTWISKRLPLTATLHTDRYAEGDLSGAVEAYDRERNTVYPYRTQRYADEYGEAADYGWSEDKARQYSKPERAGFGAFIRAIGFKLD